MGTHQHISDSQDPLCTPVAWGARGARDIPYLKTKLTLRDVIFKQASGGAATQAAGTQQLTRPGGKMPSLAHPRAT